MEIFYLKKSEFLQNVDLKELDLLDDGRKFLMDDKNMNISWGCFWLNLLGKIFSIWKTQQ